MPAVMTKQRKPGRPKKGRARERGEAQPISLEIPPALNKALEQFAARNRWAKRVVIVVALEELLAKHGLWPPS